MSSLLDFVIKSAHAADTTNAAAPAGGISFFLMMGLFLVFAYFMVWRPQSKRAKEQQQLLQSLAMGDEVMTAGGLVGRISKVADPYLKVNVGKEVEITVQKSAVVALLPKGTIKTLE